MDALAALSGQRILVTGGTGFVGEHVLRQGRDAGVELWNFGNRAGNLEGVHYLTGDMRDADAVDRAVTTAKPTAVLHLATLGGTFGSAGFAEMVAANVAGFDSLLRAVKAHDRSTQVVATGTALEYADRPEPLTEDAPLGPSNEYSITKAAGTLVAGYYARELPVTVLRLFNVYGPGEPAARLLPQLVASVRQGKPVELTTLEPRRDFVYVSDVADGLWRAVGQPAVPGGLRILNLGTGRGTTFRGYIETAAEILRSEGLEPDIRFGAKPARAGEAMNIVADVTRLRATLGWVPDIQIETGLRRTLQHSL